jgi:hypothetical protein
MQGSSNKLHELNQYSNLASFVIAAQEQSYAWTFTEAYHPNASRVEIVYLC